MTAAGTLRDDFRHLIELAVQQVAANLEGMAHDDPSLHHSLTLHDWWEHLELVVMPDLLLAQPGR
jgi:hypothetical protein